MPSDGTSPVAPCDGHEIDDMSKDLMMRFDSQFWRMNCQMFSWLLSSGDCGGDGRSDMVVGILSSAASTAAQPLPNPPLRAQRAPAVEGSFIAPSDYCRA